MSAVLSAIAADPIFRAVVYVAVFVMFGVAAYVLLGALAVILRAAGTLLARILAGGLAVAWFAIKRVLR